MLCGNSYDINDIYWGDFIISVNIGFCLFSKFAGEEGVVDWVWCHKISSASIRI